MIKSIPKQWLQPTKHERNRIWNPSNDSYLRFTFVRTDSDIRLRIENWNQIRSNECVHYWIIVLSSQTLKLLRASARNSIYTPLVYRFSLRRFYELVDWWLFRKTFGTIGTVRYWKTYFFFLNNDLQIFLFLL